MFISNHEFEEALRNTPDGKELVAQERARQAQTKELPPPPSDTEIRPWGPLPGRKPAGPFPLLALPTLAQVMAITVAEGVQVSYDMTACMVLGAISAAAAGRVSVRENSGHEEPCQLYIAVGANPSERKSSCMNQVFQSLYDFEEEENIRRAPAIRQYMETREMLEDGISRAKKAGDRQRMAEFVDELIGLEEVKPYELILTDTTPEALTKAMARNGGRMAVVSSEGVFFSTLAGGYSSSGAANVDVVLKGYSGEPVKVERVGRAGERIRKASLSLCLAVQPEMLQDFLSDPTLSGRGMASRFLAAMPISNVGGRARQGIPINETVLDAFGARIRELLSMSGQLVLTFSPEADKVCDAWFLEVEQSLNPGGELAEVGQGWGGKLYGNTLRLAGLMQLITTHPDMISAETMEGAVQIARWFRDHALHLMAGEDDLTLEARGVLQYLTRRAEDRVKESKVKQTLRKRKMYAKTELIDNALLDLDSAGFVRLFTPTKCDGTGRPFGRVILLHPTLLKHKADAAPE